MKRVTPTDRSIHDKQYSKQTVYHTDNVTVIKGLTMWLTYHLHPTRGWRCQFACSPNMGHTYFMGTPQRSSSYHFMRQWGIDTLWALPREAAAIISWENGAYILHGHSPEKQQLSFHERMGHTYFMGTPQRSSSYHFMREWGIHTSWALRREAAAIISWENGAYVLHGHSPEKQQLSCHERMGHTYFMGTPQRSSSYHVMREWGIHTSCALRREAAAIMSWENGAYILHGHSAEKQQLSFHERMGHTYFMGTPQRSSSYHFIREWGIRTSWALPREAAAIISWENGAYVLHGDSPEKQQLSFHERMGHTYFMGTPQRSSSYHFIREWGIRTSWALPREAAAIMSWENGAYILHGHSAEKQQLSCHERMGHTYFMGTPQRSSNHFMREWGIHTSWALRREAAAIMSWENGAYILHGHSAEKQQLSFHERGCVLLYNTP